MQPTHPLGGGGRLGTHFKWSILGPKLLFFRCLVPKIGKPSGGYSLSPTSTHPPLSCITNTHTPGGGEDQHPSQPPIDQIKKNIRLHTRAPS